MITIELALLNLLAFFCLAFALYRVLMTAISKKLFKPFFSCVIYWLFILITPYLFMFTFAQLGNHVYTNYPSLSGNVAWDVGLALVFQLTMYLSYIIGLIFAALSTFRFLTLTTLTIKR
jgi:hypothetical protein